MKGITPVIAIILLLLITISIIGFAFIYMNRMATQAGAAVENQTLTEIQRQTQRLSIINIDKTNFIITLRNVGTAEVPVSSVAAFVNNVAATCDWGTTTSIVPGAIGNCDLVGTCDAGEVVRITFPGGSETQVC